MNGYTTEGLIVTVNDEVDNNTTTVTIVLTLNKTILNEENVLVNVNLPIVATAQ